MSLVFVSVVFFGLALAAAVRGLRLWQAGDAAAAFAAAIWSGVAMFVAIFAGLLAALT